MLNQAQIIGYLGRDPETRYMPSGDAVTNFSIATTEKWKDKSTGEAKEATEWHRINTFGKLAEIAGKYLLKGSLVYVSGKLVTRKWTDASGVEKYSTEIKADTLKMLGGKQDSEQQSHSRTQPVSSPSAEQNSLGAMNDDIPF